MNDNSISNNSANDNRMIIRIKSKNYNDNSNTNYNGNDDNNNNRNHDNDSTNEIKNPDDELTLYKVIYKVIYIFFVSCKTWCTFLVCNILHVSLMCALINDGIITQNL